MFCSLLPYAAHALWVLLPAAFLGALYNLHLYIRLTHGKESVAAPLPGEIWSRGHSVGLSLVLAGGLGLFNGSFFFLKVQFPLRLLCVDFLNLAI